MERATGNDPATFALAARRSAYLSYALIDWITGQETILQPAGSEPAALPVDDFAGSEIEPPKAALRAAKGQPQGWG